MSTSRFTWSSSFANILHNLLRASLASDGATVEELTLAALVLNPATFLVSPAAAKSITSVGGVRLVGIANSAPDAHEAVPRVWLAVVGRPVQVDELVLVVLRVQQLTEVLVGQLQVVAGGGLLLVLVLFLVQLFLLCGLVNMLLLLLLLEISGCQVTCGGRLLLGTDTITQFHFLQ